MKFAGSVDDKSQKTGAFAGLFLAAGFSFLKPESLGALQKQYGITSLVVLYVALLLFVTAVGLCLFAMWHRKPPVVGFNVDTHEAAARLVLPLRTIDDYLMAIYKEHQLIVWKRSIGEHEKINAARGRLLRWAQGLLAGGILVATITLALMGFASSRAVIP